MLSKAILLGHIGTKKTKVLQNGTELTTISVATKRTYKDSSGEKQAITTWHNVNCFNKVGEIVNQYTEVGDLIYIEGEIRNTKLESQEGNRWVYSVTANEIKLMPKKDKSNGDKSSPSQNGYNAKPVEENYSFCDDIPF